MLFHSTEIGEIATALAKAQASMGNAIKDAVNPAFRSKYANLAAVRDATNGPLSAAGIACVQAPAVTPDGVVSVETRLVHTSGQWFASTVTARSADTKPQSIGSAITYLRRYGLLAMVGIAPDDDDGNEASGRGHAPEPRREAPQPVPPPPVEKKWTDGQRKAFCADLDKMGLAYDGVAGFCESVHRPRPSAMTPEQRSALLAHLMTPAGVAAFKAFIAPQDAK